MKFIKVVVWLVCLFPIVWLMIEASSGQLGANPQEVLIHESGLWALRFLLLTLLITPLRNGLAWGVLVRFRRMMGLYSFFYASVHVFFYISFELAWDFSLFFQEIIKRNYLVLGMLAWLILLVLALTSSNASKRWLAKKWKRLHRWVYLVAPLVVIHFWWSLKAGYTEPVVYGLIALLLLGLRWPRLQKLIR